MLNNKPLNKPNESAWRWPRSFRTRKTRTMKRMTMTTDLTVYFDGRKNTRRS